MGGNLIFLNQQNQYETFRLSSKIPSKTCDGLMPLTPHRSFLNIRFTLSVGAVAQLGERGLCKPEVVGSIPICSTSHSSFSMSREWGVLPGIERSHADGKP